MARVHGDGAEKLCLVHDGTLPSFNLPKDELVALTTLNSKNQTILSEGETKLEARIGHCSWCFESSSMKLLRHNLLARDRFECEACHRQTHRCRKCRMNFSRRHETYSEEFCLQCNGTLTAWDDKEQIRTMTERNDCWCSWCCNKSRHVMIEQNLTRRSKYKCSNCGQSTLKCVMCDAMAQGGNVYDDNCCSLHQRDIATWEETAAELSAISAQLSTHERVVAELERKSSFREKAKDAGLLRPFLCLVAMSPALRWRTAFSLGLSLCTSKKSLGDPAHEAHIILFHSSRGLCSRVTASYERLYFKSVKWADVLKRMLKIAFRSNASLGGDDEEALEEQFLSELAAMNQVKDLNDEETKSTDHEIEEDGKEKEHAMLDLEQEQKLLEEINSRLIHYAGINRMELATFSYRILKEVGGSTTKLSTTTLALTSINFLAASMGISSAVTPVTAVAASTLTFLATPLFIFGILSLVGAGARGLFGSTEGQCFESMVFITSQRLILAIAKINIKEYM